jgi:hypothetical protein
VVARAKRTPGVRDVVTAIRLRSEPLPQRAVASAPPPAPPLPAPVVTAAVPPPRGGMTVTAETLPPP